MVVAEEGADLLTACEHGHGKRTPLEDYPIKGRGGQGVINIRTTDRNGPVVSVRQCREEDDAMLITERGMIVRSHVAGISRIGRNTQGVRIVNLRKDDRLVAIEVVSEADLERFNSTEGEASVMENAHAEPAGEPPADSEPQAAEEPTTDAPGHAPGDE